MWRNETKSISCWKITKNGWRHGIIDLRSDNDGQPNYYGFEFPPAEWPAIERPHFIYVGPYFIGCDHGCFHDTRTHGWGDGGYCGDADTDNRNGGTLTDTPQHGLSYVATLCKKAIDNSDFVYAWIDEPDCYGTIAEIGYAVGIGKSVFIGGPQYIPDLWFVYTMASVCKFDQDGPRPFFDEAVAFYDGAQKESLLESPIERKLWDALDNQIRTEITPQFHIGKYRIDFVIERLKIAIELDGHDYHKTKEQRTYDASRERFLQRQGWQVVRFTGSEIWRNAKKCADEILRFAAICEARLNHGTV